MSVIGRIPVSILVLGFFPRLPPQSSSLSSGRRRRPSFEGRAGEVIAGGEMRTRWDRVNSSPGRKGLKGAGSKGGQCQRNWDAVAEELRRFQGLHYEFDIDYHNTFHYKLNLFN